MQKTPGAGKHAQLATVIVMVQQCTEDSEVFGELTTVTKPQAQEDLAFLVMMDNGTSTPPGDAVFFIDIAWSNHMHAWCPRNLGFVNMW